MANLTHLTPLDALCAKLVEVSDRTLTATELLGIATDLAAGLSRIPDVHDYKARMLGNLVNELTSKAASGSTYEIHCIQGAAGPLRIVVLEGRPE